MTGDKGEMGMKGDNGTEGRIGLPGDKVSHAISMYANKLL